MRIYRNNELISMLNVYNHTGFPIEIETNEEMDAVLIASNVGKIYKFIGTTDDDYTNNELYEVIQDDTI